MSTEHSVTRIDLLRHGACEGGEIFRGVTDVELSDTGWQQMRASVAGAQPWQQVLSSPLRRCRAFADSMRTESRPLTIEDGLRELDFGDWEGRLIAEVWADEADAARQFMRDPNSFTPPGGESIVAAHQRVAAAWDGHAPRLTGQHVLVVAHGGTIRFLLGHLLGLPQSAVMTWHIPYACMTRVDLLHHEEETRPLLISHAPGKADEWL